MKISASEISKKINANVEGLTLLLSNPIFIQSVWGEKYFCDSIFASESKKGVSKVFLISNGTKIHWLNINEDSKTEILNIL